MSHYRRELKVIKFNRLASHDWICMFSQISFSAKGTGEYQIHQAFLVINMVIKSLTQNWYTSSFEGFGEFDSKVIFTFSQAVSIQYGHRTPYWILEYWFSCHLDIYMLQHYAEKQKLSRIYWHCTVWTACNKTFFENIQFHSPLMHNSNWFYILSTFQNRQSKKGYIHESIGSCVTLLKGIKTD